MVICSWRRLISIILSILTLLWILGGCATIEGPGEYNRDTGQVSGEGESNGVFQTATPPTSPDLRGQEFETVLFISEGNHSTSISMGVGDAVYDLNASGALNGARLNLSIVKLPLDPNEAMAEVLELLEKDEPLIALMATPVDETLYYEINHQAVPFLYFGVDGKRFEPPVNRAERLFWLIPPADEQLSFFVHSLWQNWDDLRPVGTYNELRLGYLSSENQTPDRFEEETLTRLEGAQFKVSARSAVRSTANGSASNFLIDAVQNGATVIYSNTPPAGTAVVLNDLESLALENAFLVGGPIWSVDRSLDDVLLSRRVMNGYTLPLSIAWWSEIDNPAIITANRVFTEANRSGELKDTGYLIGLGSVDIVRATIVNAISGKDSGQINPEEIYQELVSLDDYKVMNGLFQVSYTGGDRFPTRMRLWQYDQENGWEPIGMWGQGP